MSQSKESLEITLGKRLREVRERLSLTQDYVAQQVEIPRQAISEIEHGKRAVSAGELFGLARLYSLPVDSLLAPEAAPPEEELVLLRADSVGPEVNLALSQFQNLCREFRWLEEQLEQVRSPDLRPLNRPPVSYEDAWRLASEERKRLDLGATPAWSMLEALEERVGVKILSFDAEWSLSGASLIGSHGRAIFLNRVHPQSRRVFTLAHEFFHLLVNEGGTRPHVAWAHACSAEPGGKPREESLADQFAAEFLMPRDAIEERIADEHPRAKSLTGTAVIHLAVSFGVSTQAMLFRLGNLGKLGKSAPAELYADPNVRQQNEEVRWNADHPPVEPRRFKALAATAFLAGLVSRARLSELIDVPLPEIDEWVAPYRAGEALSEQLGHVG
ncbi:MAG: XRE family transcriptional regulator [Candidatus Eisenbacteria bacterium]|nr:XRE family transcriptional regulator [Candidatus Eisenbacteria bacterium]